MPKKTDLETRKELAKIAMTAALGVTVLTAPLLKRNKLAKNIHTGAGVLLVGFSLWHHYLYQPANGTKTLPTTNQTPDPNIS
ncbi:MAG: hypothetical protein CSA34_01965 [Desulfobulbus propionicus]|nr:MAG: hypothetical protein CSA34_01965 [Desulfobulbus propionicus]